MSSGVARWTYNRALSKQEDNYKRGKKFILDSDLRKELTRLKQTEEFSWLYNVSNNIAKQSIKDCCNAYKSFFKGLTKKPKFKSKRKSRPSFYNDPIKLKVKDKLVLIEKVGWVKTSEQLPIGVKYYNPRVTYDGKYWCITVGVDKKTPMNELTNESIGIDVGIKELAVCSDGAVFENINKTKVIKKLEKRLRRLQRQVSRKYEMNKEGNRYVKTSNIIKLENRVRLLHRRLTNIRDNYIHQTTTTIVKTKPCRIVMETLNIRGMMKNKHIAKSIAKQKLYFFKTCIKYKCEKYGIEFIEADMWFPSSKMCSDCGFINKNLKLSDRVYKCSCGNKMDRDLNASINLSRYQSVK